MKPIRASRIALLILLASWGLVPAVRAEDSSALKKLHLKDAAPSSTEPTPVVGVRGLDKSKDTGGTTARDYEAIDRLNAVVVSAEELKSFAKDGKLQ